MTLFNPVFNCLTPKGIKRLKTQTDEGLTPADEAGSVVLRQPPASKLANLFKIDISEVEWPGAALRSWQAGAVQFTSKICSLVGRATMADPSSAGGAFSSLSARCFSMLTFCRVGSAGGVEVPTC